MSVECLLCKESFRSITNTHLKFAHGITTDEYQRMFPSAALVSPETCQALSDALMGHPVGEETRKAISIGLDGFIHSEWSKQKMAESQRERIRTPEGERNRLEALRKVLVGRPLSEERRQELREAQTGKTRSEEARRNMSEAHLGLRQSEESNKLRSEAMKALWKDPDYQRHYNEGMERFAGRKPSESELYLQSVLDKYFLGEWKYVGDGQVYLGGRNPDFININGKKQVIELFGTYWHDPDYFPKRPTGEELTAHYKEYGFDCLIIQEYDVEDVVAAKVHALQRMGHKKEG